MTLIKKIALAFGSVTLKMTHLFIAMGCLAVVGDICKRVITWIWVCSTPVIQELIIASGVQS